MNKNNLKDFEQEQMAKEMNARLFDIKNMKPDEYPRQLKKAEGMLRVWLIRMGELNE